VLVAIVVYWGQERFEVADDITWEAELFLVGLKFEGILLWIVIFHRLWMITYAFWGIHVVPFIPLAKQEQIYVMFSIAFRTAVLDAKIFVIERQDVDADGRVKVLKYLCMSLSGNGKLRFPLFSVLIGAIVAEFAYVVGSRIQGSEHRPRKVFLIVVFYTGRSVFVCDVFQGG